MNKKIFGITTIFIIAAILATPVFAEPANGQKVPVRLRVLGYYSYEGEDYSDACMQRMQKEKLHHHQK